VTAKASYTVTASNRDGSTTATLIITVIDAPPAQALANLGQQNTPLAPQNSRFEPMNPDLPDNPLNMHTPASAARAASF
jgi:hypothetical protein